MTDYEQILKNLKKENIDISGKHLIIPYESNIFNIDGFSHFGRYFPKESIIYAVYNVEDSFDTHAELVLYRVVDTYTIWISDSSISHRTTFYIAE